MDLFQDYAYEGYEKFLRNFEYPTNLLFLSYHLTFFTVYLLNFYILAPRTLPKKKIINYIIGVFVLFFVFAGIRYVLEEFIVFEITGKHNYYENGRRFFYYVFDNSYFAIKAVLFSLLLYLYFLMVDNKNRLHQLDLNHKKAELSLLKTQLEPHFLFNTLNSFYTELIDTQPETAKDIFKLSQLLRYVTYEAQQDFMPLDKELQFVEDYVHLQRKRFENTLFFDYSIEGSISHQRIPSLVLIHFVENIFKHGVLNDSEFPAKLHILIDNESLKLETENKISTSEKYSEKGIGEDNLRRRLTAIYGEGYSLNFKENDLSFKSYLKLPLQKK